MSGRVRIPCALGLLIAGCATKAGLVESETAREHVSECFDWMMLGLRAPCTGFHGEDLSAWVRFSRSEAAIVADSARRKASWGRHGYRGGGGRFEPMNAIRKVPTEICP
jgi:hypothetical protein